MIFGKMIFKKKFGCGDFFKNSLIYFIILSYVTKTASQIEKAILPKEENALSLWLVTRTGWVYCERAGVYMNKVEQRFNEVKCKKCYMDLFNKYKNNPHNVTDKEIIKCSRNFGASLIPSMPSFTGNEQFTAPFDILRQVNPFESVGVRAITCNSEITNTPTLRIDRIILPTAATIFQLFSTREFSQKNNDAKRKFPRKSYVVCLFGKLFETELALCPINANRRRCAIKQREVDEELIFSTNIPISYT